MRQKQQTHRSVIARSTRSRKPLHRLWQVRRASLFVGTLVLLICLATFATGQAQLNNQRFLQASDPAPTQLKPVDATVTRPLSAAPSPSSKTKAVSQSVDQSAAAGLQKTRQVATSPPACNRAAAARAKLAYEEQVAVEDSRDSSVLNKLRMSELVQLILNPSVYTMHINEEKSLHEANLSKLTATLQAALAQANCK